MRTAALSAAALLAGCQTVLGPSIAQSAAALAAFEGRPLAAVVDRLGYPDREEKVLDATAYIWGEDHETGPVCIWRAVANAQGIVVDTSVYGNPDGCGPETRKLQS